MVTGPLSSRKTAKDRWLTIVTMSIPDLRRLKEKKPTVDMQALEVEVRAVRETVRELRRRRAWREDDLPRLLDHLRGKFPSCPAAKTAQLAKAIVELNRDGVERALLAIAGHRFGRERSGVRDLLAAYRNRDNVKNLRRVAAGKQRYVNWLHVRGFAPPRAVAGSLPPQTAR
jgi:hypothetical protein